MSSLAMQIRIRRWPSLVPVDSSRTRAMPGVRRAGAGGDELGGGAAILVAEIVELAGQRAAAQRGREAVQQALVSGVPRYHVRIHKGSRDSASRPLRGL